MFVSHYQDDKLIEFGRPPVWNCPMPDGEEEHRREEEPPRAPQPQPQRQPQTHSNEHQVRILNTMNSILHTCNLFVLIHSIGLIFLKHALLITLLRDFLFFIQVPNSFNIYHRLFAGVGDQAAAGAEPAARAQSGGVGDPRHPVL